jgi:hypothetical protein
VFAQQVAAPSGAPAILSPQQASTFSKHPLMRSRPPGQPTTRSAGWPSKPSRSGTARRPQAGRLVTRPPCPSALQEKSASCLPALRSLRRPRRSSRNLVLWAVVDAIQPATAGPVCPGGHPAALGTFSARLCVPSRIPNGIRTDASALKRGVRYQPPQGLLGKHHVGEECACGWRVNPDVACLGEALHVSVGSLSAQSVSGASDEPRRENG